MAPASRIRQIGWALVLACCAALMLALTFKVNAVKSDVRLVERRIVAAERAKLMLETEFQARASQQQLSNWNAVEFGYGAPRADQYLENSRQLAALGVPRGIGAPRPIRVAMNEPRAEPENGILDGWLAGDEAPVADPDTPVIAPQPIGGTLAQRLARPTAGVIAVAEVAQ